MLLGITKQGNLHCVNLAYKVDAQYDHVPKAIVHDVEKSRKLTSLAPGQWQAAAAGLECCAAFVYQCVQLSGQIAAVQLEHHTAWPAGFAQSGSAALIAAAWQPQTAGRTLLQLLTSATGMLH